MHISDTPQFAAVEFAIKAGAKPAEVTKTAQSILDFLTSGNVAAATPKSDKPTDKPAKAAAPEAEEPAPSPSGGNSAASTETSKATSPSNAASGYDTDGNEITKQDIIKAATAYAAKHDEKALLGIFSKYGADKLSAIAVEDYADVLAELTVPASTSGAFD